jgi:hypothetical protein
MKRRDWWTPVSFLLEGLEIDRVREFSVFMTNSRRHVVRKSVQYL